MQRLKNSLRQNLINYFGMKKKAREHNSSGNLRMTSSVLHKNRHIFMGSGESSFQKDFMKTNRSFVSLDATVCVTRN